MPSCPSHSPATAQTLEAKLEETAKLPPKRRQRPCGDKGRLPATQDELVGVEDNGDNGARGGTGDDAAAAGPF